jgi:fructokinase
MIVVVGEALVDVVTDASGETAETPGGSPLNVAVGLGRLEVPTTLITQVGDDDRGGELVGHVRRSGAGVVAAPTTTGRSSVARAQLDRDGVARYDFDLDWSLPTQELPPCQALHVGSLGTVLEPGRASVLDLVTQAVGRDLLVSYDVNVRESFVPDVARAWAETQDLAARCGLVKLSDEDAEVLAPGQHPDDTARRLLEGERTQLVLLTRGPRGATAYSEAGEVSATPRPISLVDTVGAGDAFMAATLARLHDLGALGHRSRWGHLDQQELGDLVAGAVEIAALTCERRGANPPTRAELSEGWPRATPPA